MGRRRQTVPYKVGGIAFPVPPTSYGIEAYLGHRNLQDSARYTELGPGRIKDFWRG